MVSTMSTAVGTSGSYGHEPAGVEAVPEHSVDGGRSPSLVVRCAVAGAPNTTIFLRAVDGFAKSRWHLYYARWTCSERRRFGGQTWTLRAELEPISDARRGTEKAYAKPEFVRTNSTARDTKRLLRDPEVARIFRKLVAAGYEAAGRGLGGWPFLFRKFPGTRRALRAERDRLEAILGAKERSSVPAKRGTWLEVVLAELGQGCWSPCSAGWSSPRPLELSIGGTVVFSILLHADGRLLEPEGSVLIWPEGPRAPDVIERLAPAIRAAGYRGGVNRTGGRPARWVGDFWSKQIGKQGLRGEIQRLERLALELKRVQGGGRS
jgi:hypothetical protein